MAWYCLGDWHYLNYWWPVQGIIRGEGVEIVQGSFLWMHSANKGRCYIVTSSLIGWVHSQNDPLLWMDAYGCTIFLCCSLLCTHIYYETNSILFFLFLQTTYFQSSRGSRTNFVSTIVLLTNSLVFLMILIILIKFFCNVFVYTCMYLLYISFYNKPSCTISIVLPSPRAHFSSSHIHVLAIQVQINTFYRNSILCCSTTLSWYVQNSSSICHKLKQSNSIFPFTLNYDGKISTEMVSWFVGTSVVWCKTAVSLSLCIFSTEPPFMNRYLLTVKPPI